MTRSKTPWTPGPWQLDDNQCDVLAGHNRHLASIWLPHELDPAELQIANARLIAAAPAMAELLSKIAGELQNWREQGKPRLQVWLDYQDEARALLDRIGAP